MFAGTGLREIVIVACCVSVFMAVAALTANRSHRRLRAGPPPVAGPPIADIAQALGIPASRLRNAFEEVGPPSRTPRQAPSEQQLFEHSRKLAVALDLPLDRLRSVLAVYRPPTSDRF